jgi:ubiquinone/menaquinone biosynthesis C-methylase UbiE
MTLYHASNISGLTEIKPLSHNHKGGGKVCYFTPNREYALFYLRGGEIPYVTCGVLPDGRVKYNENFPNQLELLYKNRSGWIYTCEGEFEKGHSYDIYTSSFSVNVVGAEFVPDVLTEIYRCIGSGKIHISRYTDLSQSKKHELTEHKIIEILRDRLLEQETQHAKFIKERFPQSWERAQRKYSGAAHYDSLVDENNDPVHDPDELRDYMDKWDGQAFIDALKLASDKSVLEIGVGTGRLAVRVSNYCGHFSGIDISPKTIVRAQKNLMAAYSLKKAFYAHVQLIYDDFINHNFTDKYDIIYSSLTFMHIRDKRAAIEKIASLLIPGGRFVLSLDKNQQTEIDFTTRKVLVYPDNPDEMRNFVTDAGLTIENEFETEFAVVMVSVNETTAERKE